MMGFFKRLFLSLYFYEKKYEHKRFFDAWWQLIYTLSYIFICFLALLINLVCGLTSMTFDPIYYLFAAGTVIILDFFLGNKLRRRYEHLLVDKIKKFKPFLRWHLYLMAGLGLMVFIYSFTFIQGSLINH